jgi:hypothetical protein
VYAILFCFIAFAVCYLAGRRAVWAGFLATMIVGYFYGIVRANMEAAFAHFIFDFGALGFYFALLARRATTIERFKMRRLMPWVLALVAWPLLIMLIPLQPILIQLVGLRGQIFFIPFILVGALVDGREMRKIATGLAILGLIELVFALAEIEFGVERFYPVNVVDQIIYSSYDVTIGSLRAFRIPATFENSAGFGVNMALSVPLLLGDMVQERRGGLRRKFLLIALGVAVSGVLLSASRSQATLLFVLLIAATFSGRVRNFPWFGWVALLAVIGTLVAVSPRMQRFVTLGNTEYVKARVSSSVNSSFLSFALEYPIGNGLGGGGTSIPYFLQSQLRNPVELENEYGRIMLEQGLPGLALWIGFIVWILSRPLPRETEPWYLGKLLARVAFAYCFLVALTGTGLLTSIPASALLLVFAGWVATPNVAPATSSTTGRRPTAPAGSVFNTA